MSNETTRPFVQKIVSDAREYVQSLLDENHRLHSLLSEIQEESKKATERYVEVEQQNTNLANLYVASYQLHGTLDRERILESMKEIIINLIGSEELAIWEVNEEREELRLATSFGIDQEPWRTIPLDSNSGLLGIVTASGVRYIAGQSPLQPEGRDAQLLACVPLKLDERVIGAIGIFSLLAQKEGLQPVDYELFDLLASHGATALYCTRLAEVAA